ncbi:HAMP domain-containing sensor histidine kinase [Dyadobacter frigoris]|uniref:histidine kinase n=1 Tax=Dyadobacter frigoris TaxID=2576211 RepID=A0A4U6D3C2_9BACT|nr:ATP-binding protein [Dyadobacter frigoris]TKT90687.1 HAMP domain-containing protein [Dyadobacter frigoris]GLU51157.1 PAS domain-containing sensor histidine kinase [Dyadobacter frigoris]
MKIKTKLTLGIGLLFFMILLLSSVGIRNINALKNDSENILIANYNTLEYARNMLMALDEIQLKSDGFDDFEKNLDKQKNNVTEQGEAQATDQISHHLQLLKANPKDETLHLLIRKDISEIMRLNMIAIQRKSDIAKETARTANIWIVMSSTICFLLGITLLINLPSNIANPVRELTDSIREIAAKNYSQRVYYKSKNEFGELADSFNSMAEKLEEYNSSNLSKLLIEKKRIETLINNMHEPVIGLDENKRILFINNEALKISGLRIEDVIGKTAQDVAVSNDLVRSLIGDLSQNVDENKHPADSIKIYADEKESYFEKEVVNITIVPTGEKEKKLIGQVIVLKNITPFKELDFAKTNFIATVSHELKTPIASIKMSLQLLENQNTGPVNAEQHQLIDSIKEDSDRLLKITGELLNMSQVETGNIQLSIQESSPAKILEYALDAVKVQAEQKQVELIVNSEENLPSIKADTEKTAWVMINFLTNAIRYSSPSGQIHVQIKRLGNLIQFSVKDEGKGIDSRYRSKIFNRYFQVPGSAKTGTGLGLAISKEFIEAQGGHIGVTSEIGMGSTFYFDLAEFS